MDRQPGVPRIKGAPSEGKNVNARTNETQGRFSPDGHGIAYTSDETGTPEVYVQPFPTTGAKWQVSSMGGSDPQWRGDGRELFYVATCRRATVNGAW